MFSKIKGYIRKSLQIKIYVYFILIMTVAISIVGISTYFVSIKILTTKVIDSFSDTVNYIGYNVTGKLNDIKQITEYVLVDNQIKEALKRNTLSEQEKYYKLKQIDQQLTSYSSNQLFSFISAIKVYGDESNPISFGSEVYWISDEKIRKLKAYEEIRNNNGQILWSGLNDDIYKNSYKREETLVVSRSISDLNSQDPIGVMFIFVKTTIFDDVIPTPHQKFKNESDIIIMDNNSDLIYTTNESYRNVEFSELLNSIKEEKEKNYNTIAFEGETYLIDQYVIEEYGWKIYGVIPYRTLTRDNQQLVYITIAITIGIICIGLLILYYILSKVFNPIKNLTQTMKSINKNKTYVKVDYKGEDEIAILSQSFNKMIGDIHQLFGQVLEEERKKTDLEFRLLEAQINPHFINNTLNTIRWMAIIQKADNIKYALDAFGELLSNVNQSYDKLITIKEEISYIENYIYIEKLRYGEKFEVFYNIEEKTLQSKCLKFILQPIIENSIFHGIESKQGDGRIEINIFIRENKMFFRIIDNGIGMTQLQQEQWMNEEKGKKRGVSGIGLKNIDERIKLYYGNEYGLFIRESHYGHTCIEVVIKHEPKNEEEVYD